MTSDQEGMSKKSCMHLPATSKYLFEKKKKKKRKRKKTTERRRGGGGGGEGGLSVAFEAVPVFV